MEIGQHGSRDSRPAPVISEPSFAAISVIFGSLELCLFINWVFGSVSHALVLRTHFSVES
jgi:hypothetical protein